MSLLALEPILKARLSERLPSAVKILSAPDLDAVGAGSQPTPAVYVVYSGGAVTESRPDGRAVRIAQDWLILVAVRHVSQSDAGASARAEAGDLADQVIAALMSWQPAGTSAPLRLSGLPNPGFVDGYQWVPLTFSTEITRRIEPGT
jgi:hypothetical protein